MKRFLICLTTFVLIAALCAVCCACSYYKYVDLGEMKMGDGVVSNANAIDIDWQQGSVTVLPTQNGTISLSESGAGKDEALRMRYVVKEGTLYVRFAQNNARIPSKCNKKLTVYLPQSVYDSINVRTVSADVNLQSTLARTTKISTVSGDVQTFSLEATELVIDTTSGDMQLWDTIAEQTKLRSVSGDVLYGSTLEVTGAAGAESFSVETTSGDLLLDTTAVPKNLHVKTISGNVKVIFPADTTMVLSAKTVSGDVSNRLVQGGDCFADVQTTSGDITVMERGK